MFSMTLKDWMPQPPKQVILRCSAHCMTTYSEKGSWALKETHPARQKAQTGWTALEKKRLADTSGPRGTLKLCHLKVILQHGSECWTPASTKPTRPPWLSAGRQVQNRIWCLEYFLHPSQPQHSHTALQQYWLTELTKAEETGNNSSSDLPFFSRQVRITAHRITQPSKIHTARRKKEVFKFFVLIAVVLKACVLSSPSFSAEVILNVYIIHSLAWEGNSYSLLLCNCGLHNYFQKDEQKHWLYRRLSNNDSWRRKNQHRFHYVHYFSFCFLALQIQTCHNPLSKSNSLLILVCIPKGRKSIFKKTSIHVSRRHLENTIQMALY